MIFKTPFLNLSLTAAGALVTLRFSLYPILSVLLCLRYYVLLHIAWLRLFLAKSIVGAIAEQMCGGQRNGAERANKKGASIIDAPYVKSVVYSLACGGCK